MDVHSSKQRSFNMSRIRSPDTKPELLVRSLLHRLGYRFRLHDKKLPGTPDIILPKYKTLIFVHGCFWHRHEGCRFATTPATNTEMWLKKFEENCKRDERNLSRARQQGWDVIIVWECELNNIDELAERLKKNLIRDNEG